MKKLYLAVALLAILSISACSSDDSNNNDNNCVTCQIAGSNTEVCEGENGNAYYSGVDSGVNFYSYISDLDCN
ncbi:hypothetical protein [Flavobacterium rhizosphaerae]|uniref:Lipoprotein n=1 Tax=Flavobacterium rhizosphaerae TaxID=3163298 RepID=A0ABW8Z057_9FLAO